MIEFDKLWGKTRTALTCTYQQYVVNTNHRWMHTDTAENYDSTKTPYLPEDFDYRINDYGYRGSDFQSIIDNPTDVILYIGCSFTFGVGCPFEDTWAYRLHQRICAESGKQYKYLNLGAGGCGLDYIARTLSNWLQVVNPVAVFVLVPELGRKEVMLPGDDFLSPIGVAFDKPISRHRNWIAKRTQQAQLDVFVDAYGKVNDNQNSAMTWKYNLEHIRSLLEGYRWYWQTWHYDILRMTTEHPSVFASVKRNMLPHYLQPFGALNKFGYIAGTGRDHQHAGLKESLIFVERNFSAIKPFWE